MIKNLKQKEYVFNIITDYIEEKTGLTADELNYTIYDDSCNKQVGTLDKNEILINYKYNNCDIELFVYYKSDSSNFYDGDDIFTVPEEELESYLKVRTEIDDGFAKFEFYDYDKKNFKRVAKAAIDYIHNNI